MLKFVSKFLSRHWALAIVMQSHAAGSFVDQDVCGVEE